MDSPLPINLTCIQVRNVVDVYDRSGSNLRWITSVPSLDTEYWRARVIELYTEHFMGAVTRAQEYYFLFYVYPDYDVMAG